jgi:SAM-dependent methyltransferase
MYRRLEMGSAEIQGTLWGGAATDWADLQEPTAKPLWIDLLRALGVERGSRLLDAGCGAAGALIEAERIGCELTGLDASQPLLQIARKRLPEARLEHGDLEQLPFRDGSFDAVLAANSVMYAADMDSAMRELTRVVRSKGRVAIAGWGSPEDCEMRVVFGAVRATLPSPPPGGGPFALSAPGALAGMLEKAGLRVVTSSQTRCEFRYPNAEVLWRAQSSSGPLQGAMRAVGEATLKAAVLEAARPYMAADGSFTLRNVFVWSVGERT